MKTQSMTNYEFAEIVLVDFPQSGRVQGKKRPVLVVLDIGDADVVLAPITTRERLGRGDYRIRDWKLCGLLRASWLRLAKIACLRKGEIIRQLGQLTEHDENAVSQIWRTLYAFSPVTTESDREQSNNESIVH